LKNGRKSYLKSFVFIPTIKKERIDGGYGEAKVHQKTYNGGLEQFYTIPSLKREKKKRRKLQHL